MPIKNLINDAYAKDISKKVKTALITKKKNGEFVGSYAPYGYCKSKFDKHKFIIDEEASKIVKIIFEKTINGLSKKEIANILNEMKIETPIEHIKNRKENKGWNSNMIYEEFKLMLKGNVEIPFIQERYETLIQTSKIVKEKMNGNFYKYVYSIHSDIELFEVINDNFPSFKDN